MRRGLSGIAALGVVGSLLLLPGCKIDPNQVIALAAYNGTFQGLKLWAKKHPAEATEAATALSRNLKDEIIPYLNGAELKPSAEIDEFINSSLFKNVPESIRNFVQVAASVLDEYLPIPSASKLKPEQLQYLKTFCTNTQRACDDFLASSAGVKSVGPKERRWVAR